MKLIKADMKDLVYVKRPYSDNYRLLCEFKDSNDEIVEVKEYTQKSGMSCASSLYGTTQRYKELFGNIKVLSRKDRVFLLKEPIVK